MNTTLLTLAAVSILTFSGATGLKPASAAEQPTVSPVMASQQQLSTSRAGAQDVHQDAFFAQVDELVYEGNYAGLLEICNKAIEADPQNADAYYYSAFARAGLQQDPSLVIADLDKALAIAPDFVEAYMGRAYTYEVIGELKSAIADYDMVLAIMPENLDVLHARMNDKAMLKDWKGVLSDCNYWITLAPEDPSGYYFRAITHAQLGSNDQALEDLKKTEQLLIAMNLTDESEQIAALIADLKNGKSIV